MVQFNSPSAPGRTPVAAGRVPATPARRQLSPVVFNARLHSSTPVPQSPRWRVSLRSVVSALALIATYVVVRYAVSMYSSSLRPSPVPQPAAPPPPLVLGQRDLPDVQASSAPMPAAPVPELAAHDRAEPVRPEDIQVRGEWDEEQEEAEVQEDEERAQPALQARGLPKEEEDAIRLRFVLSSSRFTAALDKLDQATLAALDVRAQADARKRDLKLALAALEADLSQAMMDENFHGAHEAQMAVDAAHRALSEVHVDLERARRDLAQLDVDREALLQAELEEIDGVAQAIELSVEDRAQLLAAWARQAQAEAAALQRRLEDQAKLLEDSQGVVAAECGSAQSEIAAVKEKVAHGTTELRAQRAALEVQVAEADAEIERLAQLLKEKHAERERLLARVRRTDEEISTWSARYMARLSAAEQNLAQCRVHTDDLALQAAELNDTRALIAASQQSLASHLQGEEGALGGARVDLDVLSQIRTRLQSDLESRRAQGADKKALPVLRRAMAAKRARMEVASKEMQEMEMKTSLEMHDAATCSEVADKDLLESQKTLALSAHAFQEAARLAREIQTLPEKRHDALEVVERVKARLDDKRQVLAQAEQELAQAEREYDDTLRTMDSERADALKLLLALLAQAQASLQKFTVADDQVVRAALSMIHSEHLSLERRLSKMKG